MACLVRFALNYTYLCFCRTFSSFYNINRRLTVTKLLKNSVLKFFRVLAHYIREGGVRLGKGQG